MKEDNKTKRNLNINSNKHNLKNNSYKNSDEFIQIINNYFIKIKHIKEESSENIDKIYEKISKINKNEILSYINKLNEEQINSIINTITLNFIYDENLFLIKEEEFNDNLNINLTINNNENNKIKIEFIFFTTYSIIKEIIEDYLITKSKYTNLDCNLTNDSKNKLFDFYFNEFINISNSILTHYNNLIKENNNIIIIIFDKIIDIFILFLKNDQKCKILSENQKNQLFQTNLKLLINLEQYTSKISLSIIEKVIMIIYTFYLYYSLDSDELKEIHQNKFNEECLIKLKQYIFKNINNYNEIHSINIIINFIEIIILYDYINDTNDNLDTNKLFNLSYVDKIKIAIKKNINLDENTSIKQQIESIINFLKEPNKKENYDLILKFQIDNNEDIIQLKKVLINITEETNYNNILTQIQKKNNILINNNESLKKCYIKIKEYFILAYEEIINFYKIQSQHKNVLCIEEKYIKLIEIFKLLKYLLITPEEENLLILIKDKIFNYIIPILDINLNGIFLFNDLCRKYAFAVFDIITQNENIFHNELIFKETIFLNYILKEFINYITIFKNLINNSQQNNFNLFNVVDKTKFQKISKIICELSKNKEFLKSNLQIINFSSLYLIFLIDEIDSYSLSLYINILNNFITLIQNDNLYLLSNEDNNILASLIINLFNKYNNNIPIRLELFSLIEAKYNDEYFIKLLLNNNLSSIIFSIFSSFSKESDNNQNKNDSQCILPALNTIYNLLKYNFFIIELLNIGINNVINCLNQYIFNTKICEIFLLIILKIIENKENINMLINRINITDVKKLVINILEKYLDTCHKNIIKYSLEVIGFFIESPNNLINFSKSIDKNNRILMACLFKCINLNLSDSIIINLSIKILFRYISYIKINKEKSRINSLESNLEDEEEEDDLPDELFSEEYPQVSQIFKCKYFKEFIENYLIKLLEIYLIKQKNPDIIKNIIEIMRILISIIDSKENLETLFSGIIDALFKFLNIFIKYDENAKKNSIESIIDLIKHFTFLSYKIISIKNEIISNNIIRIISLILLIINNFNINLELMERFLQIIYDICLYGNKIELLKSINNIKTILDKFRELYKSIEIKVDKKEVIILIFTNILKELCNYNLDILNNNLFFIFENMPTQNIKNNIILSDNNKNEEKIYPDFKDKLLRICSLYYIESNDEAILFLNIIKKLYNQYTSLSTEINKTNYEIRFLLCIIYDLCIKAPYLKEEILKDNQSILSEIKIYINHLSKSDSSLNSTFEKCMNEMKNQKQYSSKDNDIIKMRDKVRNNLLIEKIKNEAYEKMKSFLLSENIIFLYTKKDCIKCKIKIDENLRNINLISNENEIIDSIKIDLISTIIKDNSNQAFTPKGFFSHKTKSSNCFSIYAFNNEDLLKEQNFNIECLGEEIASNYVKYFNILIELDNSIEQIK